jgi:asparagine synthase (glutamine-hydrolysing)
MAVSLEVRCPLLDHRIMELLARVPPRFKISGATQKYLFKKAMEPYLPEHTIYRTKMGFRAPLAEWFRGGIREFARAYILERDDPYLAASFIRTMWDQHQSGVSDRSAHLWNVLMFRLWLDRFIRH